MTKPRSTYEGSCEKQCGCGTDSTNVGIGIVRDGIRGTIVEGNRRGFLNGVAYGQLTNIAGHVLGISLSGFASPAFENGAFIYDRVFMKDVGAITLGNVISGSNLNLYLRTLEGTNTPVIEHERAHIPQSSFFGALYMPIHGLTLGVTSFLPGGNHGRYNFLECSALWISVPHGGICSR